LEPIQHVDFTKDFSQALERLLSDLDIKRSTEEPKSAQRAPAEQLPYREPARPKPEPLVPDIFIGYAREDEARIRELALALEEHGWSIFWEKRIPAGKNWESYIRQALNDAKCVIIAWSQHSIHSNWVREEAYEAKERGILAPVLLDSVKPPLGFRGINAADLTDWKPGYSSPRSDLLIQDIARLV
jgi:hypothetical protein